MTKLHRTAFRIRLELNVGEDPVTVIWQFVEFEVQAALIQAGMKLQRTWPGAQISSCNVLIPKPRIVQALAFDPARQK